MKQIKNIFDFNSKAILVLTARESQLEQLSYDLAQEEPTARICWIRGWKCRTEADFHNEIAAAIQFPLSYGENWAAFSDFLGDMRMQSVNPLVLIVARSGQLFENESYPVIRDLVEIISGMAEKWSQPEPDFGLAPKVLKLVLQEDYGNLVILKEQLSANECEFEEISV
ncbi:hypothetical protein BV372_02950 [Nostoc sp. T09]|uniref:barstar family protein n=1 Tax=Nostoc sp. T09 TaxID=1932621 RepID=UPI000A3A72D8|nr:barstar family protein [Nostoc sp. T09]OUL37368.1 hypothetical protein BV372_02950 [Nostoc sp. T09]